MFAFHAESLALRTTAFAVVIALATCFVDSKTNAQSNSHEKKTVELPLCIVMLIEDVDVAARQAGVIKTLDLREGQYVESENEIGKVDDLVAQRQLEQAMSRKAVAEAKASNDRDIEYYKMTYAHWFDKHKTESKLVNTAKSVLADYRFEALKALNQQEQAKNAKNEAALEVALEEVIVNNAKDLIERHAIYSPIEGNVFEIYKPAGSWVNAGDPIFRVIRMNKLKVQGFVDAKSYDRHEVFGQKVSVNINLARGRTVQLTGKVTYVGLDQHAGNRYIIRAEVENRSEKGQWLLAPNDTVQMSIHLGTRVAELDQAPTIEESTTSKK